MPEDVRRADRARRPTSRGWSRTPARRGVRHTPGSTDVRVVCALCNEPERVLRDAQPHVRPRPRACAVLLWPARVDAAVPAPVRVAAVVRAVKRTICRCVGRRAQPSTAARISRCAPHSAAPLKTHGATRERAQLRLEQPACVHMLKIALRLAPWCASVAGSRVPCRSSHSNISHGGVIWAAMGFHAPYPMSYKNAPDASAI